MEPQARYAVVGASVLILLGMIVAVVGWLLGAHNGGDVTRYKVYFANQSLEGLEAQSEVHMRGIRVGSVTSLALSSRRPGSVEVAVELDAAAPVRESTRAVVDRNLITGVANIGLVTLEENSPLLHRPPPGEADAVIPEGESQLQQFSQTLSQLAQRADEALQRISSTLSSSNQAALGETLENLRFASRNATTLTGRLDATLASVGRAADALNAATRVATADLQRLTQRYDTLGAESSAGVREATTAVRQLSTDLSRLASRTEDVLSDADIELRVTGQELRSAADAVRSTSRRFSDPRAALFGPADASLGPGEARR